MRRAAVLAAVGGGILFGALGRNLPVVVAGAAFRGSEGRSCGIDAAVECAFANLPGALGEIIKFGFLVIAVASALAVAGVVTAGVGVARLRRRRNDEGEQKLTDDGGDDADDWAGLGLLGGGVALSVPAAWLLSSFLVFVLF